MELSGGGGGVLEMPCPQEDQTDRDLTCIFIIESLLCGKPQQMADSAIVCKK